MRWLARQAANAVAQVVQHKTNTVEAFFIGQFKVETVRQIVLSPLTAPCFVEMQPGYNGNVPPTCHQTCQ